MVEQLPDLIIAPNFTQLRLGDFASYGRSAQMLAYARTSPSRNPLYDIASPDLGSPAPPWAGKGIEMIRNIKKKIDFIVVQIGE